jgi:hypothetical protein
MRPSHTLEFPPNVRVDSYPLLAVLLPGLVVYSVVLAGLFPNGQLDVVNVTYALLGVVFVSLVWESTHLYDIQRSQVVIHRFFGLLTVERRPNSSIHAFRQKPNYTGHTSLFEVKFASRRKLTLHIYQRNFQLAVSALKAFNPGVPTQDLNKWGL